MSQSRWMSLACAAVTATLLAGAARAAGAEAVTLVNTVMGMAIDPETRRFRLGSGPAGGARSASSQRRPC